MNNEDDEPLLVPAALRSNPSTPARGSMASGYNVDSDHSGLIAFPRPRDSIGDNGRVNTADDDDNDANLPDDSRMARRKKNQYKRHGSLTLAWQQQQLQQKQQKWQRMQPHRHSVLEYPSQSARSRLSASDIGNANLSNTAVALTVSPISTPLSMTRLRSRPSSRSDARRQPSHSTAAASSSILVSSATIVSGSPRFYSRWKRSGSMVTTSSYQYSQASSNNSVQPLSSYNNSSVTDSSDLADTEYIYQAQENRQLTSAPHVYKDRIQKYHHSNRPFHNQSNSKFPVQTAYCSGRSSQEENDSALVMTANKSKDHNSALPIQQCHSSTTTITTAGNIHESPEQSVTSTAATINTPTMARSDNLLNPSECPKSGWLAADKTKADYSLDNEIGGSTGTPSYYFTTAPTTVFDDKAMEVQEEGHRESSLVSMSLRKPCTKENNDNNSSISQATSSSSRACGEMSCHRYDSSSVSPTASSFPTSAISTESAIISQVESGPFPPAVRFSFASNNSHNSCLDSTSYTLATAFEGAQSLTHIPASHSYPPLNPNHKAVQSFPSLLAASDNIDSHTNNSSSLSFYRRNPLKRNPPPSSPLPRLPAGKKTANTSTSSRMPPVPCSSTKEHGQIAGFDSNIPIAALETAAVVNMNKSQSEPKSTTLVPSQSRHHTPVAKYQPIIGEHYCQTEEATVEPLNFSSARNSWSSDKDGSLVMVPSEFDGDDNQTAGACDLTRHPTLVFDNSPILRASALINCRSAIASEDEEEDQDVLEMVAVDYYTPPVINPSVSDRHAANTHLKSKEFEDKDNGSAGCICIDECRASEELAHEMGKVYISSRDDEPYADNPKQHDRSRQPIDSNSHSTADLTTPNLTSSNQSIPKTIGSAARVSELSNSGTETTRGSMSRSSLFPNVVRQQSRCLSMLLHQGPHGGIRRIGPLLITKERGGGAIKNLNPAFIDMMDVQPVDTETKKLLKKSNIRRRSFSMPPGGEWLNTLGHIIGGGKSNQAGGSAASTSTSGPGMWWPLNDDNCSEEMAYDVQFAPYGDASGTHSQQGSTLDRMGSVSTVGSNNNSSLSKPPISVLNLPRKDSGSSQTRMKASNSSSDNPKGYLGNSNPKRVGGQGNTMPSLCHTASDASDASAATVTSANGKYITLPSCLSNPPQHSSGNQLTDVTMKTETGVITRSVKSISLRLLVNRLASPEGNVDSELMTDFLNAYRFFAHPIDVMRLVIARYLNCFTIDASSEDDNNQEQSNSNGDDNVVHDSSASKVAEVSTTTNGWPDQSSDSNCRDQANNSASQTKVPLKKFPLLSRNDGAIIQLRVMNLIKYWIKFHPHDFRLHHRLTRLLLLFLSHIQKQPGRAEFVNSIRQKLSSGKLLAVEMPAFASSNPYLSGNNSTLPSVAPPANLPSVPSLGGHTSLADATSTRSAIDLKSMSNQRYCKQQAATETSTLAKSKQQHLHAHSSMSNMYNQQQQTKKGSSSYFKSLFHSRSNKAATTSKTGGSHANQEVDYDNHCSVTRREGTDLPRSSNHNGNNGQNNEAAASELNVYGEHNLCVPNGNMYANDFGSLVMEALAKSGIPTPQTPVGRTLLNYSIAKRNPYRINLVGIDPATFAEQLTLLEHELFSRISATEFSLKGRVGNLENILLAMQGASNESRNSSSTLGSHSQLAATATATGGSNGNNSSASNPVPSLTAMSSWFNQVLFWAIVSILSEPTTAARALVVKQLIHIAFHCLARRNYYGASEIAFALEFSAVRRLHDTWALVPTIMKTMVTKILDVLHSRMNYRVYRESVKAAINGGSGPDEEVFEMILEQIKSVRAKDIVPASHTSIFTANGVSSMAVKGGGGHSHGSSSTGLSNLVHGALFGSSDDPKHSHHHSRKKSMANNTSSTATKDNGAPLTEQDCACIMYAIRIRAASFMYFDPSSSADGGTSHSSVPTPSPTTSASKNSSSGNTDANNAHSHSRRARSTSNGRSSANSGNGSNSGSSNSQTRRNSTNSPLPVVPLIPMHMTDLLHADEANSTYSSEHQKMRSRNPTGPSFGGIDGQSDAGDTASRRQMRCDSTAVSSINQGQPLLNMQKFKLITSMFRDLCLAQRTKYPYVADTTMQQQIYSAVRNIKAQANDIIAVVQDVAAEDTPSSSRFASTQPSSAPTPFARSRKHSGASNTPVGGTVPEGNDSGCEPSAFGYPLYHAAALQKEKTQDKTLPLLEVSMDWDYEDQKENQELEHRLYMLSKWVEPQTYSR